MRCVKAFAGVGLLATLWATGASAASAPPPALIPQPVEMTLGAGRLVVDPDVVIHVSPGDAAAADAARYLSGLLARTAGFAARVQTDADGSARGGVVLTSDPTAAVGHAEGYVLDVGADGIRVAAHDASGLFYGAISAWQLLTPGQGNGPVEVPFVHVADWPRFAWRGLMLDVARHYEAPADIEVLLDAMAQHKLNVFHWHLTDDQGWRLQIRRYPKLTEVGAWRTPPGPLTAGAAARYGGFYTQAQVRQIVAYAAARHITVVPEIDMPGHAQAAVAAYPDVGVTGQRPAVSIDWGVNPYLFNVDDHTLGFLQNVLDEVTELFPSTFIHVGGDEAVKDQWQASPAVQARMRTLGIKDEKALQTWFIEHMGKYLAGKGRRLIGWDEILEGGLPPSASVMSWRGTQGAIDAATLGHDVVLSPAPNLYFDNLQSRRDDEPSGRFAVQTLADVYAFETVPSAIPAAQARHVLGAQANLWTEYITAPWQVQHAVFPRIDALAEAVWTPVARRDFGGFVARLPAQFARYRAQGIGYADSAFAVDIVAKNDAVPAGKASITLGTQVPGTTVRYTVDGTAVGPASPTYAAPFVVTLPGTVRATSFAVDGRALSAERTRRIDAASFATAEGSGLTACPNGEQGQRVPLLPDATGASPMYNVNIFDTCWIFPRAPLDGATTITIDGAWLARNYGLAHDIDKVIAHPARTAHGEIAVHLDRCDGPLLAELPLTAPATPGVRFSLTASLPARTGRHDLCLVSSAPLSGAYSAIGRVSLRPPVATKEH